MIKQHFIAAILLAGSIAPAFGQETKQWTLNDCIDYALQHNIDIQKGFLSMEQGEVSLWQTKGALLPSLSFSTSQSVGYRPFTQTMSIVQGDLVTSTRSNVTYQGSYGLNANMTVWNGGINRKNIEAQQLQNELTQLNTERSQMTIQEQIAQLYVQIMYSSEAEKVNEQLAATAKSQYERAQELLRQGQMSKADVAQLEAQWKSSEYDIVSTRTQTANFKRQLKALLELDLNSDFDVCGQLPTDEQALQAIPAKADVFTTALQNRPEMKSAELQMEAADLSLDIARRGYLPTIGVGASLGTSHTSGSNNQWGEQMKSNLNMSAGVNISVPIFDNRRNASSVKKAKLEKLTSSLNYQDQKNELSSTIEQYWLNASSNQQRFLAARSKTKSLETSYELLNAQFQNGLKNIVELLQGRDNLVLAKQDELQSKYMAILNMQMLRFYCGEKFDF